MNKIFSRWYEAFYSHVDVNVRLFTSGLYLFLLLKIVSLISVAADIILYYQNHQVSTLKKILVLPAVFTFTYYPIGFLIVCGIVVVLLMLAPRTYLLNAVGFLLSVNVMYVGESVSNGSDYVLLLMLLLSIPITQKPIVLQWQYLQQPIYNVAVRLIQVHVALIYLLSGYDKLVTKIWRSGEVMNYIAQLDYFAHPLFIEIQSRFLSAVLSWFTILFELLFPVLIWFAPFRVPLLVIGVLFHLGIIYFLNLPDFGLMMIFCYAIFLRTKPDSEFGV